MICTRCKGSRIDPKREGEKPCVDCNGTGEWIGSDKLANQLCMAGRLAKFGGRWGAADVHDAIGRHVIIAGGSRGRRVCLCADHFAEVLDAGLITDPYVSEAEALALARREQRGRPPA